MVICEKIVLCYYLLRASDEKLPPLLAPPPEYRLSSSAAGALEPMEALEKADANLSFEGLGVGAATPGVLIFPPALALTGGGGNVFSMGLVLSDKFNFGRSDVDGGGKGVREKLSLPRDSKSRPLGLLLKDDWLGGPAVCLDHEAPI